MTLRHALTMRTGQAWTGEEHLDRLYRQGGDWFQVILDYEMEMAPGKKWYYNSGIAILLGALLNNATGMDTKEFARKYLFEPLHIDDVEWRWGQFLFVVPKYDMVVVFTCNSSATYEEEIMPVSLIYDYILPSVLY